MRFALARLLLFYFHNLFCELPDSLHLPFVIFLALPPRSVIATYCYLLCKTSLLANDGVNTVLNVSKGTVQSWGAFWSWSHSLLSQF